jgi:hypothetical protein
MSDISNIDVMNHVMNSLFKVISTRTTPAHAWLTLRILMQKVEYNYNFLRGVELIDIEDVKAMEQDTSKTKDIAVIDTIVMDAIEEKLIGEAIQALADQLQRYLGKKAGYHLLREFRDDLGDKYYGIINGWGVDLRLDALQNELYAWMMNKEDSADKDHIDIAMTNSR